MRQKERKIDFIRFQIYQRIFSEVLLISNNMYMAHFLLFILKLLSENNFLKLTLLHSSHFKKGQYIIPGKKTKNKKPKSKVN